MALIRFSPFPSSPHFSSPLPFPLPSLFRRPPLEVGPVIYTCSYGVRGALYKLPSGVWGTAPAEIEFCAFQPLNRTSVGIKFAHFSKNQLITVCQKYTAKFGA